jgi:acetyltransferase-like isoleucine patch superfamily enzyme
MPIYPTFLAKAFDGLRYRSGFFFCTLKWGLVGLRMGRSVQIYSHVIIHDAARVSVGDNSSILSFTVLFGSGKITIGRDVLIASHCSIFSITHRTDALERGQLFRGTRLMAPVVIEDNVWIGTGVRILPGVTIGANTIVGAGSVVNRSLPSGVVAAGVPVKVLKGLNATLAGT